MNPYLTLNPARTALLTIDVQNDFTLPGAPAEVPGTRDTVPNMRRLVEAFRAADRPIVHVVRLYRADGSNVDLCRRDQIENGAEIVRPGSNGAELVDELKPCSDVHLEPDRLLAGEFQPIGDREWVLYKPRWSAFYDTPLEGHLRERGVNTVIVCGCNFPNCPRTTIYAASQRDYRVGFVADATSGTYDRGIGELQDIGVAVKETGEAIDWISGPARSRE